MVNFRFHLVSLTAVFLALAAGIAIGAGVVDRQTVDFLERSLRTVEQNRDATNRTNDELRADLDRWSRFSQEVGDQMIEGRLEGVPVVMVGVEGTDNGLVEAVRNSMAAAGASAQGTVWFTDRWGLADEGDVERLAQIVNASPTTPPEELRALALSRLVFAWAAGAAADVSLPLRDAGFLEFDPPPGRDLSLEQVPLVGSEVVIVSGPDAAVPNNEFGLAAVRAFLDSGVESLVAEPAQPRADDGDEPPPPGIAKVVRDEDTVSGRVSSVDTVDDYRGRMAAVFALAELRRGRTGHYGIADGAQRLLPEPAP